MAIPSNSSSDNTDNMDNRKATGKRQKKRRCLEEAYIQVQQDDQRLGDIERGIK